MFCGCTARFISDLVGNPEDRFSHNEAHIFLLHCLQLGKKIKTPADQEIADYQELMNWLTTEAVEVLEIVEQPVEDRQQEYMVSYSYNIANRSLYRC